MSREEVLALLARYNVPLEAWGKGDAKTLTHLIAEIESAEAWLEESPVHGLMRVSSGTTLSVYFPVVGGRLVLKETKQVFADGRIKVRPLDFSIGEKRRPDETPESAAYRALREELGIDEAIPLQEKTERIKGPVPSVSFPGLTTFYTMHHFIVILPKRYFRPEGYIEHQQDKTNYYEWVSE